MKNQTIKIDPTNRDDEANSAILCALRTLWCAREDLNLHVLADTATSRLRVYHFTTRACKNARNDIVLTD